MSGKNRASKLKLLETIIKCNPGIGFISSYKFDPTLFKVLANSQASLLRFPLQLSKTFKLEFGLQWTVLRIEWRQN